MKIRLCVLSCSSVLLEECFETALEHATGPIDIFGFYNGPYGSIEGTYSRFRKNPKVGSLSVGFGSENRGVPAGLHALYEDVIKDAIAQPVASGDDILVYVHDDVHILEHGWDKRVEKAFVDHPKVGLAGFGGSTALGGNEIYRVPYEIHQLGRRDFYSNMNGAEVHGIRTTQEMPIVSTDGMSMIVRRRLLDTIGGWSWWPFELVHHAYDYGIACMNRRHGYEARLIPCTIVHKGGLTACGPVHQEMAKKYGGDTAVHTAAHQWVYDNFRDVYPMKVK